jgi:hypothetical protein
MSQTPKDHRQNEAQPPPPSAFDRIALIIINGGSREPSQDRGPGAWDQFAAGLRNGLADFVGRVFHGETRTPEPDKDLDKGIDR